MPKNANLVVFRAKNPDFYWKKQKFVLVPTLRKNHPHILLALFFGQAWDEMGQKYKYLAQNDQKCKFLAKFGRFWAKNTNSFSPKKHPKSAKRLIFIWEKATSFFVQLRLIVARTWCPSRSAFLGPIIRISAQKYVFCYRSLEFVNGPFEALGETVDFAG